MENLIHTHKTFEKVSFTDKKVNNREFEDCIFKNCDFSNSKFLQQHFYGLRIHRLQSVDDATHWNQPKNGSFQELQITGNRISFLRRFYVWREFSGFSFGLFVFCQQKNAQNQVQYLFDERRFFYWNESYERDFQNCNLDNAVFNETQLAEPISGRLTITKLTPKPIRCEKPSFRPKELWDFWINMT